MSTIKLPPLPAPLRARIFDGMASVYSPDQLRARDLEVTRVVLEAAATKAELSHPNDWAFIGAAIRALEFKHG